MEGRRRRDADLFLDASRPHDATAAAPRESGGGRRAKTRRKRTSGFGDAARVRRERTDREREMKRRKA